MELHEILSTLREEKDMKQHEVAEKDTNEIAFSLL